MEGSKDALNGITFDGKPSGYRDFRRKTLLAIAGLEDKHSHLAGPRLLSRLSGEAWRATEHLNISQLRSPEGFMIVIRALDEHYKYLPETELHESIDEFLFALKRRQGEGATAFASRFRTQLARVETLISQEREMTKSKRRRTTDKAPDIPPVDEAFDSEMEHTASEGTGPEHDAASHRSAAASAVPSMSAAEPGASEPSQPADAPRATETGTAEHAQPEGRRTTSESAASTDLEEKPKHDDRRAQRPGRREAYAVQEQVHAVESDSSSLGVACESDDSQSDDVMAVDQLDSSEEEFRNELEEVYELQRKSKEKFRKSFKTYKETKKRVKELKRNRQPYYPVVALNQPQDASQSSQPSQTQVPLQKSTFKYDKKPSSSKPFSKSRQKESGRQSKKEEANMTESILVSSFAYMVEASNSFATSASTWSSEEVLLASIPEGHAILDTGCTTSVIGSETADKFKDFLKKRSLPQPTACELPPVELKGFQGGKVETTTGLRWHVKLGKLWGSVTTYLVPGQTPFLLSRRVLEGMKACIDLGNKSITSEPHGMFNTPLRQAANGHFLMPLYEIPEDLHVEESQLAETMIRADVCLHQHEPNDDADPADSPTPSVPMESPGSTEDPPEAVSHMCLWTIRLTQAQLVMTRVLEEPETVRQELAEWLGPQSSALDQPIQFLEVKSVTSVLTNEYVYALDDEFDADGLPVEAPAGDAEVQPASETRARAKQIVTKLHINTGHSSPEQMMRLANRCHSSDTIKDVIRNFHCPVCEELKLPTLRRNAAMPHADQPNQVVAVDYVQIEVKREEEKGDMLERKFNALTCVCLATDFCQQIIVPETGTNNLSKAHWQLGRVEIANRVLRDIARRVWRTTSRPVEEDGLLTSKHRKILQSSLKYWQIRLSKQRCISERMQPGLRPVPEDESEFRRLAKQLAEGRLHPDVEAAEQNLRERAGQFHDCTEELPNDDDFELDQDVIDEPDEQDDGDDDDDDPMDKPRKST
ncbi:unnamed protein product [Cladocopium goreaui]|uniref:Copia protein n=1 Tax=Cladocopium goreaui TaxID=2562237 RepID=A0A9P1C709_9DINO|nr:unnamed protein product [Cladocopium goreaui]